MMFSVEPKFSLIDEITTICVSKLNPLQKITLTAKVVGDKGGVFESHAHFIADKHGQVDVCRDPSVGGSYSGVSAMGLLWSMKPAPGQRKGIRLIKYDVTKPYVVELKYFKDHVTVRETSNQPMALTTFLKGCMADGVRRIPVKEGRTRGTLFLPPGNGPFPGVIDILGGIGGLVEWKACLLASHGFAALALAYFAFDDLPVEPEYFDLDYFAEAAEWLRNHPSVVSRGVGLHSICMGTWLALLLTSYRNDLVKAVVAIAPWNAPYWKPYRCKGKLSNVFQLEKAQMKVTDEGIIWKDCFARAKEAAVPSAELPALTPVERITCPILLVYGTDDQNIDSEFTTNCISERLKAKGKESFCTILRQPNAGHIIEPPYTPLCNAAYMRTLKQYWVYGGDPKDHAFAQETTWRKILDFLGQNLRTCKSTL